MSVKGTGSVVRTGFAAMYAGPETAAKMATCGKEREGDFASLAKNVRRVLIPSLAAATSAPSIWEVRVGVRVRFRVSVRVGVRVRVRARVKVRAIVRVRVSSWHARIG